jgi:glycosyltransferase involved in cell wall biosynthesis
MHTRPLLTIGIPTFNRDQQLKVALNNLAKQLKTLNTSKIELLVSDNSSTDSTIQILKDFSELQNTINFKYISLPENIGFDKNCNQVIKNASGRFVWILSDDDKIYDSAVETIFKTLQNYHEVPFVFVNYQLSIKGLKSPSRCQINETKRLSGDEFMVQSRLAFTFCSSCIVNKDFWNEKASEKYYGSNFYHVFLCRDIIAGREAVIIGTPLIEMKGLRLFEARNERAKSENARYEFFMTAHLNMVKFSFELKDYGFSDETCNQISNLVWSSNLRQIFYYKATVKKYSLVELMHFKNEMTKYFGSHPSLWLLRLPILFLPSFISGNIYLLLSPIYKFFKQKVKL